MGERERERLKAEKKRCDADGAPWQPGEVLISYEGINTPRTKAQKFVHFARSK